MRKKIMTILLCAVVALGVLSGCGRQTVAPGGKYVVQIRHAKAGYGNDWLYAAVEEFNKIYLNEGISAKVEESEATITAEEVVVQTKDYQKNNIDLYFVTGGATLLKLVDASPQILRTSDYTLIEDLTDLFKQKAIGLDKKEEEVPMEEKMSSTSKLFASYYGSTEKWQGSQFLYQWTNASSGFVYNEKVLEQYGISKVPRTTAELKVAFDKILEDGKGNNVYPVAWGGNNAAGYWEYPTQTWFAQYAGYDEYMDFYRLKPESGDTIKEGWKVYENEGWLHALENLQTFCNTSYAASGTLTTVDHLGAQDLLVKGKAAFCTTGDWMYNEMYKDPAYKDLIEDVRVMRVPVVSELGIKLGLHANADICDNILSDIIGRVDEGETDADIVSAINAEYSASVNADQVKKVRAARGVYYDLGFSHQSFIPYHSDAKEAAKLFLRFLASNDYQRIYRKKANGNLPFTYTPAEGEALSEYQLSLDALTHSASSQAICDASHLSQIRAATGIMAIPSVGSWVTLIKGMAGGSDKYVAQKVFDDNLKSVSGGNWSLLLETAGIR